MLGSCLKLYANNSHLIVKVENMIENDDTYYITSFIESNRDYRNLGPFYEELLDHLSTNNTNLEYFTIFARAGACSLLRKAEELQYSNKAMSDALKKSTSVILDKAIEKIYKEWLRKNNEGTFLLRNALDMKKLSFRLNNQLQNDLVGNYFNYISYGEIYLALNNFSSAVEYFRIAKDLSSQLETQEYANIADVYISMAESNSSLFKDGTIFDYASFISSYNKYLKKFNEYQKTVTDKAKSGSTAENNKLNAVNVSLKESQDWSNRLNVLNNRIFGEYNFVQDKKK